MITFKQTGNFFKFKRYTERIKEAVKIGNLNAYGREGVAALQSATPIDSGLTAKSWDYEIHQGNNRVSIVFTNSNIQNGVPIAVIIQYGHASRNGRWVEGRDYINPAIQPVFDKIAESVWKEVTRA